MVDPEKIFNIFESTPEQESAFINIQNTPTFKLGMFKKIIWNQKNIENKMGEFLKMMPEVAEKIDMDNDVSEFVTHVRAWTYLKDFDPTSEQGKDAMAIFADDYTITACDLALVFWEEREAYEKCAHIKKVQDSLKLNVLP